MRDQEPPRPPQGMDLEAEERQGLAGFLRQHRKDILSDWEHALHLRHPEPTPNGALLRDHLPDFLDRLADAAEHPRAGGAAQVSQTLTDEDALERLEQGYEPGAVALEYGLLRHSILQCLEH
ncbi:RsbRD N-terminal domain-containing protein, partial [Archangium sp.]|uniref:RsbRD N-terminal domain-containing protein n=1 Tax=Archangium sp. TaxID=1872627 RepID=UPI002EDA57F8